MDDLHVEVVDTASTDEVDSSPEGGAATSYVETDELPDGLEDNPVGDDSIDDPAKGDGEATADEPIEESDGSEGEVNI